MKNTIYLAGDMLSKGAQRQREYEAEQLRNLGLELHVPQEDKSINDKANAVQEGLAERIVSNDTKGIIESDVIVIDAHENGKGTLVELGQVKGMKDMAKVILETLKSEILDASDGKMSKPNSLYDMTSVVYAIERKCKEFTDKKVFPHNTDVRRENRKLQAGDRREYAPNQYVYGTVLDLTDGHGFYEFDEITEELSPKLSRVKATREKQIEICEKAREYGKYSHRINFDVMSSEQLEEESFDSYNYLQLKGVSL